jgi:cytochrome c biogenesis protein CcdA
MANLPATIVSSIGAIQPLTVLFFERLFNKRFGGISRDTVLIKKLVPIILIVIGVILIYSQEIIKLFH